MTPRLLSRLFVLGILGLSSVARAESADSAVAQALFDQAKALLAAGHAAEACPKLEESQRLDPRSGTLLNLANCYEQTGRLASAWTRYVDAAVAAQASGNPERETVARERAAALAPRLSRLAIVVAPALKNLPGLELRRDGVVVGQPAWGLALPSDNGEHRVPATAPGHQAIETLLSVTDEGKTTTVNVPELTPLAPDAEPGPQASPGLGTARVAALVMGGIGVVGVGVGTVFGLVSKSKHNEAEKYCNGVACTDQRGVAAGDAAQTAGDISTVTMIVGGVGLAAGLTLWLTAPKTNTNPASAQVGLGLGTLQVKGTF